MSRSREATVAATAWLDRARGMAAPLGVVASLLAACVITSGKKFLWYDELATMTLLTDPSLGHMLRAMQDGADNVPPLYHLLGRLWVAAVGSSALALRLLSSLGMCVAAVVTWRVLRRAYPGRAAAIGLLTVFCASATVLRQNVEVRFYGVWMALCALGVAMYATAARRPRLSGRFLVATAITHAAIVATHTFGILYSGAILLALLVADARAGRRRPAAYASIAAGWLALVPWIGPLLGQSRGAASSSWIPLPGLAALLESYQFEIALLPVILLTVVLLTALEAPRDDAARERAGAVPAPGHEREALLIVAFALLLVPALLFVLSHAVISVFHPRYLMPAALAWTVIVAHLVFRLGGVAPGALAGAGRWTSLRRRAAGAGWVLLGGVLVLHPVYHAVASPAEPSPGVALDGLAEGDPSLAALPVAVESGHEYFRLSHYRADAARYFYIADRAVASDPASPPTALPLLNYLSMYSRLYAVRSVIASDEFLCAHERFLTLDGESLWFDRRVAADEAYAWRPLGRYDEYSSVVLVERRPGAQPHGCAHAGGGS